MSAPELRVTARVLEGGEIELADVAALVAPVTVGENRRWRRRAVQHVAALSGVSVRDVVRELDRAERTGQSSGGAS